MIHNDKEPNSNTLTLIHTPDTHTIDEVCSFLGDAKEKNCKAVVYQKNENDEYIVLFIRGDLDVNETKLTNYLGFAIHPAIITDECGLNAEYIGPYQLESNYTVLFDASLENTNNLACGGNKPEHHYTGLDIERDIENVRYFDFAKIVEGGICPECGCATLSVSRGVEVGNIFQLGTKYTTSMNMTYLDKDGNTNDPIMGCYGIGVGRLAASICEAHYDEYGPIWPMSVAPWQVHICAVRADDVSVKECADKLYTELQARGIEVIYDDRAVSAGVMFSDADLLGIPLRIIVSPRNMKENCCEIVLRDKKASSQVPLDLVLVKVLGLIDNLRQV